MSSLITFAGACATLALDMILLAMLAILWVPFAIVLIALRLSAMVRRL